MQEGEELYYRGRGIHESNGKRERERERKYDGGEGRATTGWSVSAYMNHKRPQSCNIKTNSVERGREWLQVGGNERTLQRGAPRPPDRAPVRAQTYWHRSAPSALRLSWPPGLWAHLQIVLGFLQHSESLSLCYSVRWERSSCDWKLIRPFYPTIWPVNQHPLQSCHICRVLSSSVAATGRGSVSAQSQRTFAAMLW